jgi:murein DD-endopeptidase MepM/ murein hydrolase activator NlpD
MPRIPAALLVLLVFGGFGVILLANGAPAQIVQPIIPTQALPTDDPNAWQNILREGFGENSTPLPTIAIPTEPFVPPTLIPTQGDTNLVPLSAAELGSSTRPTLPPFSVAAVTPTPPLPTVALVASAPPVTVQMVTRAPNQWRPPPLIPPLSRDPLGRDHYWFQRPVDSNANNAGLFYYPYGSDGPQQENPWRVHHGIDMPNPVGETVRAGGSGEVIWAADGLRVLGGSFENSPSYGNVVVIQHDFGYRNQPLFTLYAHLSAVLVRQGQYVQTGEVIGLVGETGRVSGPHVHFEVRMGRNHYSSTYNPVLWMVPYVGHGVIAGRVTDANGRFFNDVDITIRNWATGLVHDTTTSYVFLDNTLDVNPDPIWGENFAVGDVPVGRYEVIAVVNGERLSKIVEVFEGTTTLVELKPEQPATAQPVETQAPS